MLNRDKICSKDNCNNTVRCRDLCKNHYSQFQYSKDFFKKDNKSYRKCSIDNCERNHEARGFCKNHYNKFMNHGDPLYERKFGMKCLVENCNEKNYGNGYCRLHYGRLYRNNTLESKVLIDGRSKNDIYGTYISMNARCYSEKSIGYKYYGGRGITVCERWLESFDNFEKDMGERPSKLHSLDRIDNNKGYSKENCRWATKKEQARNTSKNVFITFQGETKCISEWAEEINIPKATILSRFKLGMIPEECFTKPRTRKYRLDDIDFMNGEDLCRYIEKKYSIKRSTAIKRLYMGSDEYGCTLIRKEYTEYKKQKGF